MARHSSSGSGSNSGFGFLRSLFSRRKQRPEVKAASRRTRRRMFMEPLEGRALMATDLGAIEGLVYIDNGDNIFQVGEEVVGADVNLYLDDGDNVFEPGAGDTLQASQVTDANGEYVFEDLGAGTYWVEQPAQTVGTDTLVQVFDDVTISALQEQGVDGELIDSFISAVPTVIAADPVGTTDADTADLPTTEVLGGERDFEVELTSSTDAAQSVTLTVAAGNMSLNPTIGAQGRYTVVWDGNDDDGSAIDFTGLGNFDLTGPTNASSGILLDNVNVDQVGEATIRIYTSQLNFSELTIPLVVGTNDLFFKFADFVADAGGTGANFEQVNAIELEINSTVDAMDGEIDLVRAIGYSTQIVDFDNFFESDLSLDKTVDNATPNLGANVTFTITVTNGGPDAAMNVEVEDLLPAGLTFVSENPSQGTYDEVAGVWTVGNIASGANATLQVVATAATIGVKTNTAEISASDSDDVDSTPGNGLAGEDDIDSVTVTPQQIDLSLTKTVNNANVAVGTDITFTITVANAAGVSDATGVEVEDLLPAGFTYVSDTPSQGTYDEVTGIWTVGAINAGANATLQIVATKANAGAIVNTAEISDADQPDVDSTPNNALAGEDDIDSETVNDPTIDLSLTKTVNNANVNVGSNVTFTITVLNAAGVANATGVLVEDLLPAGFTYVSDTPSQGTYDEVTGLWTVGAINAGANATLQIVATKTAAGSIINTVEIFDADQPDVDSTPDNALAGEDDIDSETVSDVAIDLSLTKAVNNANVNVGSNVTFTLTVANAAGVGNATGVVVEDLLPAGFTFVSDTPSQGTYDEVTGLWTVGAINAGANATLQIVATKTAAGSIINTAEIFDADQTDVDSTPDNALAGEDDIDSETVGDLTIDLALTKVPSSTTPNVGQQVTFTLTVSNTGLGNATGVAVTDLLPAGLTYVSDTPSQGTYDEVTGIWTVGAINTGANATLQVVATVASTGAKTNVAEVTAANETDVDSTPNNGNTTEDDRATATVTPPVIDLSVDKIVNNASPNLNQNVTFTITVSNAAGVSNATGVAVTDILPAGLTFVSSNPSQGSYAQGTGIWTVGNLNAGASATLQIVATVTTAGAKTNLAAVSAADQADSDSTPGNQGTTPNEDDTDTVVVTPPTIDLSLAKTGTPATPNRNGQVTFTLTLSNAAGQSNATNVAVTDQLPSGMIFVSANASQGTYNNTTGIWTVGTVNTGANATLTIVATATTIGTKTNVAQVTAADQTDIDSTPSNIATAPSEDDTASFAVTPAVADLSVTKTVDNASPNRGQNVTFTVTLANAAGGATATNVTVTDLLPTGLTFVSSTPSVGTYTAATGAWVVPTLATGANATLTIVATPTTAGVKTNVAEVTASDQFDSDSTPGNRATAPGEDDSASVSVTPTATDLTLSKSINVTSPQVGDNVTFTLTVSNTSAVNATGVQVTDLLPSGLTFVSATPSVGTYNSTTGVWTVGAVNAGANATLTIVATVADNSTKVNTAEITALDQFDTDSTPNNGTAGEDDRASVTVQPFLLSKRLSVVR